MKQTAFGWWSGLAALILILQSPAVHAATIVDTFGAGDTYQATGLVSSANSVNPPTDLDWAFQFTVSAMATVETYEVALHLITGSNEVDFLLMEDVGNVPGPVIDSVRVVNQMIGGSGVIVVATSVNKPILTTANEYWLGVSAASSTAIETRLRWLTTLPGGTVGHYARRDNMGAWALGFGSPILVLAYRISDSLVSTEPSTWGRIKALYAVE